MKPSRNETTDLPARRLSPEDTRRKAREDRLKNYYNKRNDPNQVASQADSGQREEQKGAGKPQPERDTGMDQEPE
jgi:hypothetical protein